MELLSCAGSEESLKAALEAGADAVYFGTTLFNARMNAKNFTREQTEGAIYYCHEKGVKCYIAMNTLITDRMMPDALRQAEFLYRAGADALILADLGLAGLIHRYLPDFELHASTQCSGHNSHAARFLSELGFSRMVAARELSEKDLFSLAENSPIETEMFVHGALCVCQSGQCLLSSFIGGRSGNRGECAQPCRMMYNSKYPLSLKDLCLAGHMKRILSSQVTSLKIEGRMKSPSYTSAVTRVYRNLIDEARDAHPDEIKALADVFSRSGFTDGYFTSRIDSSMLGIRRKDDIDASKRASAAINPLKTRKKAPKKEPAVIPKRSFSIPDEAFKRKSPAAQGGEADFVPVDSALFYDAQNIPATEPYGIGIVYLPLEKFTHCPPSAASAGVVLPPVIPEGDLEKINSQLKYAKEAGARHVLITNIGQFALAEQSGLIPHGDWRLNITSNYTAEVFSKYLKDMTLSVELTIPQIRDIMANKNVVVYGNQPLMTLEKPVGAPVLKDRTGASFAVIRQGRDELLLNSVPTYMADKPEELKKCGKFGRHYIFTTEKVSAAEGILKAYKSHLPSKKPVRRIK